MIDARPTAEHLYAAILAAPDDDAPRLAWADALDERGGPGDADRASFVRVQVELARLQEKWTRHYHWGNGRRKCGMCRIDALRRRAADLLTAHAAHWLDYPAVQPANVQAPFVRVDDGRKVEYEFRRGFVGAVSLDCAAFMGGPCRRCRGRGVISTGRECGDCGTDGTRPGLAAALFAAHPITAVRLTDREPHDYGLPEDGRRFGWLSEHEHGAGRAGLPRTLLVALAEVRGEAARRYPTADAALAALSTGCIRFGRAAVDRGGRGG